MDDIKIKISADTTDINKKIKETQQKLDSMRQFTPTGSMAQLGQNYKNSGDTERAARLEDSRTRIDSQNRQKLVSDIKTHQKELDGVLKKELEIQSIKEKGLVKGKDSIRLQKEEIALQKQMITLTQQLMSMKNELTSGGGGGGASSGANYGNMSGRGGARVGKPTGITGTGPGMSGMVGSLLGGIATGAGVIGTTKFRSSTQQERTNISDANTFNNMISETAGLQADRRGYESALYSDEKMQALELSTTHMDASRESDNWKIGVGTAAIGGSIATGLGVAGSAIATAAAAPFVAGAVGIGAAGYLLSNDRTREKMSGFFTGDTSDYDSLIQGEGSDVYQQQQKAQKAMSFKKGIADNYFKKNRQTIKTIQRGLGMSDKDLFHGDESLFMRSAKAGFGEEESERSIQSLLSSEGTTALGKEGSIEASKMARGLNLTNSGQLLGKISGRTGAGIEESKDELIRMYSEATKIGLDASNFAKETRTFLTTAADMALKSGGSGEAISGLLGSGLDVLTNRNIKASQNSLDRLNKRTSNMSGMTGQLQIASLSSQKTTDVMGKAFNMDEIGMIGGMKLQDINKDNNYIKTLLTSRRGKEAGSDELKDAIEYLRKLKIKNTALTKRRLEAERALGEERKKDKDKQDPKKINDLMSKVKELTYSEEGASYGDQSIAEKEAGIRRRSAILTVDHKTDKKGKTKAQIEKDIETLNADTMVNKEDRSAGQDFAATLGIVTEKYETIGKSFDENTIATRNLTIAMLENIIAQKGGYSSESVEAALEVERAQKAVNEEKAARESNKTYGAPSSSGEK